MTEDAAARATCGGKGRAGAASRRGGGRMLRALACLLAIGTLLGCTASLAKAAGQAGLAPLAMVFWSTLAAGLGTLAVAALLGHRPAGGARALEYYLVAGLLTVVGSNAIVFPAAPRVGAGFVALCFAFPPMLTYALALGFRLERLRWRRALGVICGLAGAAVLAVSKWQGAPDALGWILLTLAAPVLVSLGNVYRSLRWPEGASALELSPGMLLGAAAVVLPIAVLAEGRLPAPPLGDGWPYWLGFSLLLAATYSLFFVLQRLAGPVYLSQIGSVSAVVGAGLGMALFGERLPPLIWLAAPLVALGLFLVSYRSQEARVRRPEG